MSPLPLNAVRPGRLAPSLTFHLQPWPIRTSSTTSSQPWRRPVAPGRNGQRTKGAGKEAAKDKSLEAWIWDAACSIRGAKDAPKYKDYILPLIFIKRLCDVFDDELNRISEQVGSRASVFPTTASTSRR